MAVQPDDACGEAEIDWRKSNYNRMDRSLSGWKDRNADFMWMRPEMNWERHAGGRGLAMLFSAKGRFQCATALYRDLLFKQWYYHYNSLT